MRLPDFLKFRRMERGGLLILFLLSGIYLSWKWWNGNEASIPSEVAVSYIRNANSNATDVAVLAKENGFNPRSSSMNEKREESMGRTPDHPFDPDTISKDQWVDMGLSPKQAAALINYRIKLDGFDNVEEFKNSFVVSEAFFNRLSGFLVFSPSEENHGKEEYREERSKIELFTPLDLNTATKEQLMGLPGIGQVFSTRILKFRNILGGFYSVDQLHEVYGMTEEAVGEIREMVTLGSDIVKFDLNVASAEEMARHPYFREDGLAYAIVRERETNGSFRKIEDIRRVHLVNEQIYGKIAPYLAIKNE